MEFEYKSSELTLEQTFDKIKHGFNQEVFPLLRLEKKSIAKSRVFNEKTIMRNIDFTEKEKHIMKVPYLNEREEINYKENGLVPLRGYFHYIYFTYTKLPFGIFEITFIYEQLKPQTVGTRFDKTRVFSKKEIWMYCDDDNNENDFRHYVLIRPFKENDDNTQEYLKRMKMITSLYEKPEEELGKIESKLAILKNSKPQIKTIKGVKYYIKKHKEFLEDDISTFLRILYAYGRVQKQHRVKAEEKANKKLSKIVDFQKKMENIINKHKLEDNTVLDTSLKEEVSDLNVKYISLEVEINLFMNDEVYQYFGFNV